MSIIIPWVMGPNQRRANELLFEELRKATQLDLEIYPLYENSQALTALKDRQYSLIFMDYRTNPDEGMPHPVKYKDDEYDLGYATKVLVEELRGKENPNQETPILVTGSHAINNFHSKIADMEQLLSSGMTAYINKMDGTTSFIEAAKQYLSTQN